MQFSATRQMVNQREIHGIILIPSVRLAAGQRERGNFVLTETDDGGIVR